MPVNFNTYKYQTAQKLLNRRLVSKTDFKHIIESKTKSGMADRVSDCFFSHESKYRKHSEVNLNDMLKRGFVKQEEIPLIKIIIEKSDMLTINFAKILSKKDTDPEVIKTKKQIKNEYDIKSLHLDNNLTFAKKIQKALKILKDNNLNPPDEIIVNSLLNFCWSTSSNPKKHSVIINSSLESDFWCSTNHPLHIIIHEFIHSNQPNDITINFRKISEKYKNTIDNLSMYAKDNRIFEVHAELMTKKLLTPKKFTPEEQELLDYIENIFKTAT